MRSTLDNVEIDAPKSAADILLEAIDNSGVDIPEDVMTLLRMFLPAMPEDVIAGFLNDAKLASEAKEAGDTETLDRIMSENRAKAEAAGLGQVFDSVMAGVI